MQNVVVFLEVTMAFSKDWYKNSLLQELLDVTCHLTFELHINIIFRLIKFDLI